MSSAAQTDQPAAGEVGQAPARPRPLRALVAICRYLLSRTAILALLVGSIAVITFFATRIIPSDPVRAAAGWEADEQALETTRERLGLNRPLGQQFLTFLAGLARLDLGTSIRTQQPVSDEIAARLPATLELVFVALVTYVALSMVLAVASSRARTGGVFDTVVRVTTIAGSSVPPYWLALVLQLLFYYVLGWLPAGGRLSSGLTAPPSVTGVYLLDAVLTGRFAIVGDILMHLLLPVLCLVIGNIGFVTRMLRAQIVSERDSDYARTARSRGARPRRITWGYVLPNSINPMLTVIGMQAGFLIGGTVFIESIFRWPGLGSYTWDAVQRADFPAITGVAITLAIVFVCLSFLVEALYGLIDPRVRRAAP